MRVALTVGSGDCQPDDGGLFEEVRAAGVKKLAAIEEAVRHGGLLLPDA